MNQEYPRELLELIQAQRRDDEWSFVARHRPLEILAGLNPSALKQSRPRYFVSGRMVKRRRRRGEVTHGTTAMYKRGCRCDQCRLEQSLRNKEWRRSRRTALRH